MGKITSRDVARAAGVSQTTVSFALNDRLDQRISQETRQRVLDAADELGYTPSHAARALRRGRSDTVLLLFPKVAFGPLAIEVMNHLAAELAPIGLRLVTRTTEPGQRLSSLWTGLAPVAVVSTTHIEDLEREEMTEEGVIPATLGGSTWHETAGEIQARHLVATGHRHLGYAMPEDPGQAWLAGLRLNGVRRACRELNLAAPLVVTLQLNPDTAAEAVSQWTGVSPAVTGICAYNDEYAFAVLAGMRANGLSAPGDLAVVGVDNVSFSGLAVPPLTTVEVGGNGLAEAIKHLVAGIAAGHTSVPLAEGSPRLVIRESA